MSVAVVVVGVGAGGAGDEAEPLEDGSYHHC